MKYDCVGKFAESSRSITVKLPRRKFLHLATTLNKEINAGLADPKMKARLTDLGSTPLVLSPGDFGKLIADEVSKWAEVIKSADIKAE